MHSLRSPVSMVMTNLPDNHVMALMVAVDTRAVEAKPRVGKLPFNELVLRDRF